jgi:hypothetical protein
LTGQDPAVTELSTGVTSDTDTSFDAGSGRAIEPTTDTSLQKIPITSSDTSVALPEASETPRGGAESQELGTLIETDNPPSETSQSSQDPATSPFTTLPEETTGTQESTPTTVQSEDELGSTSPSSEAVTTSDGASQTLESSQPAMGSDTTELEGPTSLPNSPDTAQVSTTLQTPRRVTASDHESMASEKTLPIPKQPKTTDSLPSSAVTSENGIVTGTDGTVATYVPEQNKDYISSTGTTTTTDDNGVAIVIFPFGWFWKLDGGKGGGDVAKPPAPTANPVPQNEPGDKGNNDDDDDASTKDNDKSTADSTILSTTKEPATATTTEATTTSEECTAATQPDCTRTVSYMTSEGTQIM